MLYKIFVFSIAFHQVDNYYFVIIIINMFVYLTPIQFLHVQIGTIFIIDPLRGVNELKQGEDACQKFEYDSLALKATYSANFKKYNQCT